MATGTLKDPPGALLGKHGSFDYQDNRPVTSAGKNELQDYLLGNSARNMDGNAYGEKQPSGSAERSADLTGYDGYGPYDEDYGGYAEGEMDTEGYSDNVGYASGKYDGYKGQEPYKAATQHSNVDEENGIEDDFVDETYDEDENYGSGNYFDDNFGGEGDFGEQDGENFGPESGNYDPKGGGDFGQGKDKGDSWPDGERAGDDQDESWVPGEEEERDDEEEDDSDVESDDEEDDGDDEDYGDDDDVDDALNSLGDLGRYF